MNGLVADRICEIRGSGGRCAIAVLGYENSAAQNESDAGWLSCRVDVVVRSFRAQCAASFTDQDFRDFAGQLRAAMTNGGEAVFKTDEEALELHVNLAKTGGARISGTVRGGDGAALSFAFESDQTSLAETERQLEELTSSFHVKR